MKQILKSIIVPGRGLSEVVEDEYGDYADYDAEQDYSASNTSYEDTPEVTILVLPGALVVKLSRDTPYGLAVLTDIMVRVFQTALNSSF